MIQLSVNVNKVATVRNSRGGREPRLIDAVEVCLSNGANGITVHPRADRRHITPSDVRDIAKYLQDRGGPVEFNIEGDPRPELMSLVEEVRPHQCTLVPVVPGELTSQAGWQPGRENDKIMPGVIRRLKLAGVRVSLFIAPSSSTIRWASDMGADRVELYTEPFAREFENGPADARRSYAAYSEAARRAHELGLGVNAGHDLDLANLVLFRELPHLDEVSIGHAIISRALFVGLGTVVREYQQVLSAV